MNLGVEVLLMVGPPSLLSSSSVMGVPGVPEVESPVDFDDGDGAAAVGVLKVLGLADVSAAVLELGLADLQSSSVSYE